MDKICLHYARFVGEGGGRNVVNIYDTTIPQCCNNRIEVENAKLQ